MHRVTRSVIAIIPARGGSKGIPRKNLVPYRGKPLVVHSIEHGLAAKTVQRVIVSTDDAEIAAVAKAAGAEVPFMRPAELAGDDVLDWPVFQHVLDELAKREQYRPEIVVHLRPTTPHRDPAWIDEAVELLASRPDADSVRSVSPPDQHPYRVFRIDPNGMLDPIMKHEHPTPYLLRRQDHPPMFHYNCVIDVTRATTIVDKRSMTGDAILAYVMKRDDVIDIDSARDLEVAEALFGKA
jgi:N-acylneuraminate cytidylyltransferase